MSSEVDDGNAEVFAGADEISALGRAFDWSATPLGAIEQWSPSLCGAVRICLEAQLPMAVWAGPSLQLIFNERYSRVLRPLTSFGDPAHEVWPELERVMTRGESSCDQQATCTRSLTPIRAEDGSVVGALEIIIETSTEREQAFAAMRASEALPRLFVENAPASIAMFDRDMRYLSVSRQWIDDFRLPTSEVIGRSHYEVFSDIPERWKDVHRRALAGEIVRSDGERFDRADGTFQWLKWKTLPWRDASGEIGGILIASVDITEEKRAEAALKEADRHKDEFLATLAHELRNPLAPLRSGLEILQATPDAAIRERALATMSRQLGNLVRLVDDLLDVSRISRGKLELKRARVSLTAVIESAVETSRPLVESRGHVLNVRLPDHPVWLDVDVTRMTQVVSNLLNNATKYATEPGQIDLWATEEHDEVVIRVIDNGIGIAAEDLPRLFDLFAQVGNVRDRAQGGMGIGLSLVRRLVEMHGGTVSATSPGVGRGSTFTIRIPRAPNLASEADKPPPGAATQAPSSSQRILVVDDNVDAAETLVTILGFRGYETRMAHDGASAIAAVADFHPHLAFVDIGLPDMTGYDVARRLRDDPETRGTVLIALTGWGADEDKRRSTEAGFDMHLTKPIDAGLLEPVLALLAGRS